MFRRPSIRYGKTPEPETPYQRAAQVWDERIGSARVQARSWRYAFFGALGLSACLTAGIVWQGSQGSIIPWVVQVDSRELDVRPTLTIRPGFPVRVLVTRDLILGDGS